MTDDFPTPDEVVEIHERIEERYNLTHTGTRATLPKQTLESVIEGTTGHDGTFKQAAALLRDLTTAHVFEDGNKRTAWATTRLFLQRREADIADRNPSMAAAVMRRIKRFDYEQLAEWLATGEIDEEPLDI